MIRTVFRIGWINLKRDHVALGFTFVLPVLFFSVLAFVFGDIARGRLPTMPLALVDEDASPQSATLVNALRQVRSFQFVELGVSASREDALARVRRGTAAAAIVIPRGFGGNAVPHRTVVVAGGTDPVASFVARAAVQIAAAGGSAAGLHVEMARVAGAPDQNAVMAAQAAGMAVLFLLFVASSGSGRLLEEEESGTLERILCSKLSMRRLLLGHFLLVATVGALQVGLMLAWAALVFGVELATLRQLSGCALMTVATALAASSFGLVLATASRSRAQLAALSTTLILLLSAVGGSMVPRAFMPDAIQRLGRLTVTAWALDGYDKVLRLGRGPAELWLEVLFLAGMTLVFLATARAFARRWETA
jgi:ABC-2 type transport system permease protein